MSPCRVRLFASVCLLVLLTPPLGAEPPRTDDHGDPLPPGAVARLGTVRLRQLVTYGSGGACVVFSPDGKTLLSGAEIGLRAWDVATGKDLGWFRDQVPANAAQFSPDGKTILTVAHNGSIRRWQAGTGALLREVKPAEEFRSVGSETFLSADGKLAGASGSGEEVLLWDTETGKQIFAGKYEEAGPFFFSAALSPDGKILVVGSAENRARLLDVTTGKELRQLEGPNKAPHLLPGFDRMREEAVHGFAFAPDGQTIAATSGKESFSLWEVASGKLRLTVKGAPGHLAFSADGNILACGGEEAIRLYEPATGKEVRRFERHSGHVYALAFSPDGKTLAAAERYVISLWDVATGKRLHPPAGHTTPVVSLAFAPDGRSLASGDGELGTLLVWDLNTREPRHTLPGHYANVLSLAYSPDGKLLASGDGYRGSGGFDAQIRLWDPAAGRLLRQFPGHLNGVESLAFSADGNMLSSGGYDARVKVWDPATGQRLRQIRGDGSWNKSAVCSPDGKILLVADEDGKLALWQVDSGRKIRSLGEPGDNTRIVYYATFVAGGHAVLAHESGNGRAQFDVLRLWDAGSGQLLRSFTLDNPNARVRRDAYALSPGGTTLALAGGWRDPGIELWDITTGKRVGRFSGHQVGTAEALAFSPDGKTLASGGEDTTVLLWEVARARLAHLWAEWAAEQNDKVPAGQKLPATPGEAIPVLKDRLRRAAAVEERAGRLITDLDDDDFFVRDKASRELEGLGPEAALLLRSALGDSRSVEVRARIEKLLDGMKSPQGQAAYQPRSVAVGLALLEELGTVESRQALEELARGPGKASVTQEAAAALERLAKRRTP